MKEKEKQINKFWEVLMITLNDLKEFEFELNKLEADLKRKKEAIIRENSKDITDSVSASNPNFPYEKRHVKVTGISEIRLNKLKKGKRNAEKRIKKLKDSLQYKLYKEDTIIAEIIEKKYIHKMEWKQIAIDLGYADESGARKIFNRYFNKK